MFNIILYAQIKSRRIQHSEDKSYKNMLSRFKIHDQQYVLYENAALIYDYSLYRS